MFSIMRMCCFLIFFLVIETKFWQSYSLRPQTSIYRSSGFDTWTLEPEFEPQVYKKTAELLSLIGNVFKKNKESETRDFSYENSKDLSTDHLNKRKKEIPTRHLMKIMQRNYDTRKSLSNLPFNVIRTNYISNPEDLDRFQGLSNNNRLRFPLLTTSDESSTEDYGDDKYLKEILSEVKRRSLFRIGKRSGEEKPNSFENAKDDKKGDYVTESEITSFNANDQNDKVDEQVAPIYEDDANNFSKKSNEEKNNNEDTWETITKKYDWSTDNTKGTDKEENIFVDLTQNSNKNDWDNKKQDHKRFKEIGWNAKQTEAWQERGKKRSKTKKDKYLDDDENIDLNVNKDFYGKSSVKTDKISNKKTRNIGDWNDKSIGKSDWGSKQKVSKIKKDWDDEKKTGNREYIETGKESKHESTPEKKWHNQADRFETKKETNWDMTKHEWDGGNKRKRDRTTKRWKPDVVKINEWANYSPRKESKAKRQNYDRNVGSFMRTSIPYVGKKGIYDDK